MSVLEKRPLVVKFSKLGSESFHRDTGRCVMFKFGETGPTVAEIVRCLPDKKIKISPTVATARIVPEICQASPRQYTQSASHFIQTGSLSAELVSNACVSLRFVNLY